MRCAREALIECGYSREAEGDLHSLIGPPLFNGFADLCHQPLEEGMRITAVYRRIFDKDMSPDYYPVFPGMRELIVALRGQGRQVAVATSRLETTARQMIDFLDLPPFDAIVGRLEPGRDTKAESIRDAMAQLSASIDDSVMVGDRFMMFMVRMNRGFPALVSIPALPTRESMSEPEQISWRMMLRSLPGLWALSFKVVRLF